MISTTIVWWGILAGYGALICVSLFYIYRLSKRVAELEAGGKEGEASEAPANGMAEMAGEVAPDEMAPDGQQGGDGTGRPWWDQSHKRNDRAKPVVTEVAPPVNGVPVANTCDDVNTDIAEKIEGDAITELERSVPSPPSFHRAISAYNALVMNFDQSELQSFQAAWHPILLARTENNTLVIDSGGDFWLIPVEEGNDHRGLVVPGPEIVRKWDLFYRSLGSLTAKNLLQGYYKFGDGAPLRLDQPALAEEVGDTWKITTPGTFADA